LETPDYLSRDKLSIAMRVVKGDFDFTKHKLPENIAFFFVGMALSGDLKEACRTEILKAYKFNKKGTINLAKKIGLDLRKYVTTKNMVSS